MQICTLGISPNKKNTLECFKACIKINLSSVFQTVVEESLQQRGGRIFGKLLMS